MGTRKQYPEATEILRRCFSAGLSEEEALDEVEKQCVYTFDLDRAMRARWYVWEMFGEYKDKEIGENG